MLSGSESNLFLLHKVLAQSKSDVEALNKFKELGLVNDPKKEKLQNNLVLFQKVRKSRESKELLALNDQLIKDFKGRNKDTSSKSEPQDSTLSKQMDAKNIVGDTLLLAAFKLNYMECVALLLQNNADPKVRDAKGRDLLSYVTEKRQQLLTSPAGLQVINLLTPQEDLSSFLSDVPSQASTRSNSPLVPAGADDPFMKKMIEQHGDKENCLDDLAELDLPSRRTSMKSSVAGSQRGSFNLRVGTESPLLIDALSDLDSSPPTPKASSRSQTPVQTHRESSINTSVDAQRNGAQISLVSKGFRPIHPQRERSMSCVNSPRAATAHRGHRSSMSGVPVKKEQPVTQSNKGLSSGIPLSAPGSRSQTPILKQTTNASVTGNHFRRGTAVFTGGLSTLMQESKAHVSQGRDSVCSQVSNSSLTSIGSHASTASTESTTGYRGYVADRFQKLNGVVSRKGTSETAVSQSDTVAVVSANEGGKTTPVQSLKM